LQFNTILLDSLEESGMNMLQRIVDGRTDLVFDYLAAGHGASSKDGHGTPLIKWCAYHGDVSAIRFLIGSGESLDSLGDNFDLSGAAFHGHWQLCQFLIEKGADVNVSLPDTGETPLHAALCKANRPVYDHVVEVLLANGANPNCVTKPSAETGSFMRDGRTRGETPLHRAGAFGTERSIRLLLDRGAAREAKDMNGDSPLTWASWHLRPPSILRLLCYGDFSIHPENHSTYDHGEGWGQTDSNMRGKPHF
jgi:ankyrin repeat protein